MIAIPPVPADEFARVRETADAGGQIALRTIGEVTAARASLARTRTDLDETDAHLANAERDLNEAATLFAAGTRPRRRWLARNGPLVLAAASLILTVVGLATFVAGLASVLHFEVPMTASPGPEIAPAPRPAADAGRLNDGLAALREGRYVEAIDLLEAARRGGANPTLTLGGLAECYFYLNRDAEALSACAALNAAVPNAGRAHFVRGLVLLRQNRVDQAHAELAKAARHGERTAVTLLPRGAAEGGAD